MQMATLKELEYKQNRNRLIDAEKKLMVVGLGSWEKKVKVLRNTNWLVTK